MMLSRVQIIARGVRLHCPNCGHRPLFPPRSLRILDRCPSCGLLLERGEGFFLGPLVINYGITVFGFVWPLVVLGVSGALPGIAAFSAAAIGCFGLPPVLYRLSWSLWLMVYFGFQPEKLPANGGGREDTDSPPGG